MYDFAVYIGRFQPFHNGHLKVIREGLAQAKRVIILIGSANVARSYRNPFTWAERAAMIHGVLGPDPRIHCTPLPDAHDDPLWVSEVRQAVHGIIWQYHSGAPPRIGLIGHAKDHTSYYLDLFPGWSSIAVSSHFGLSSTQLRARYFRELPNPHLMWAGDVPETVVEFGGQFRRGRHFRPICEEAAALDTYREGWAGAPFPPTFVTADCVVVHQGQVLLVERGGHPGKGLLALPGGFVEQHERIFDAALRELAEETTLDTSADALKEAFGGFEVFDEPGRSQRGRTITHAFLFDLSDLAEAPRVIGGDETAFWRPIAELNPEHMFEDHYAIIQSLTGDV